MSGNNTTESESQQSLTPVQVVENSLLTIGSLNLGNHRRDNGTRYDAMNVVRTQVANQAEIILDDREEITRLKAQLARKTNEVKDVKFTACTTQQLSCFFGGVELTFELSNQDNRTYDIIDDNGSFKAILNAATCMLSFGNKKAGLKAASFYLYSSGFLTADALRALSSMSGIPLTRNNTPAGLADELFDPEPTNMLPDFALLAPLFGRNLSGIDLDLFGSPFQH